MCCEVLFWVTVMIRFFAVYFPFVCHLFATSPFFAMAKMASCHLRFKHGKHDKPTCLLVWIHVFQALFMKTHEWVFMSFHEFSWVSWVFMSFHEFSWVFMSFHEFSCIACTYSSTPSTVNSFIHLSLSVSNQYNSSHFGLSKTVFVLTNILVYKPGPTI